MKHRTTASEMCFGNPHVAAAAIPDPRGRQQHAADGGVRRALPLLPYTCVRRRTKTRVAVRIARLPQVPLVGPRGLRREHPPHVHPEEHSRGGGGERHTRGGEGSRGGAVSRAEGGARVYQERVDEGRVLWKEGREPGTRRRRSESAAATTTRATAPPPQQSNSGGAEITSAAARSGASAAVAGRHPNPGLRAPSASP